MSLNARLKRLERLFGHEDVGPGLVMTDLQSSLALCRLYARLARPGEDRQWHDLAEQLQLGGEKAARTFLERVRRQRAQEGIPF